jgi:hypothetical protein
VTVRVLETVFPLVDPSLAVTVIMLEPEFRDMDGVDQLVVPDTVPQDEPFTVQVTEEMPEESEAVPERVTVEFAVV